MVERLRAAGAIIIGKTNVPEFGLGSQTTNPVYGATRNAYDERLTAGGSSGGAAVALALRMLPLADGSDYGGSLRNPAGWNNVYGFRPSFGRIARETPDVWTPAHDRARPDGAQRRRSRAAVLGTGRLRCARSALAARATARSSGSRLASDVKGKRIAWVGDFGGALPFEPGVLELGRSAMKTFEDLGCIVEEASPDFPIEDVWRALSRSVTGRRARGFIDFYRDPLKRAKLKPEAVYEVEKRPVGHGIRRDRGIGDAHALVTGRSPFFRALRFLGACRPRRSSRSISPLCGRARSPGGR